MSNAVRIVVGDCLESLRKMEAESVQCCVTSPPYFGLRDYGHEGQLGLEATPELYVSKMVEVFREVRRVLRNDGTLWLNIGDSYATGTKAERKRGSRGLGANTQAAQDAVARIGNPDGCKTKDLIGIPWMLAFALRADGWYLRSDIIWHKPNPMPESVTDRPTKSHEYLFLLSKSERYAYNADAISSPAAESSIARLSQPTLAQQEGSERVPGKSNGPMKAVFGGRNKHEGYGTRIHSGREDEGNYLTNGVNARSVWSVEATGNRERECLMILESQLSSADKWDAIKTMMSGAQSDVWRIATQAYSGAHFATMPPALVEPCIKAGSKEGDTILDPFGGAGTTGLVANRLGRNAILCELNPAYAELARNRIHSDSPLFVQPEVA